MNRRVEERASVKWAATGGGEVILPFLGSWRDRHVWGRGRFRPLECLCRTHLVVGWEESFVVCRRGDCERYRRCLRCSPYLTVRTGGGAWRRPPRDWSGLPRWECSSGMWWPQRDLQLRGRLWRRQLFKREPCLGSRSTFGLAPAIEVVMVSQLLIHDPSSFRGVLGLEDRGAVGSQCRDNSPTGRIFQ